MDNDCGCQHSQGQAALREVQFAPFPARQGSNWNDTNNFPQPYLVNVPPAMRYMTYWRGNQLPGLNTPAQLGVDLRVNPMSYNKQFAVRAGGAFNSGNATALGRFVQRVRQARQAKYG